MRDKKLVALNLNSQFSFLFIVNSLSFFSCMNEHRGNGIYIFISSIIGLRSLVSQKCIQLVVFVRRSAVTASAGPFPELSKRCRA